MIETNTYIKVTKQIKEIETHFDKPIIEIINKYLWDFKFMMPEIAQELGIKPHTLKTIMHRYNIKGRGSGNFPLTTEHRKNVSDALKGRKLSKEHIEATRQTRYKRGQFKGWYIDKQGYKYIRINRTYIAEHRHIMEQYLNRKLKTSEYIHHIDGDRLNNHIENLALVSSSEHLKIEKLVSTLSPSALRALVKTIEVRIMKQPPHLD